MLNSAGDLLLALEDLVDSRQTDDIVACSLRALATIVQGNYFAAAVVESAAPRIFHPGEGWLGSDHALLRLFADLHSAGMDCSEHPVTREYERQPGLRVIARSELTPTREWIRSEHYQVIERKLAIHDKVSIFIPFSQGLFSLHCGRNGDFEPGQIRALRQLALIMGPLIRDKLNHSQLPRIADCHLSESEYKVLAWVAEGKRNAEIAVILGISYHTVRKHLEKAFVKLGVETRGAAARVFLGSRDLAWDKSDR